MTHSAGSKLANQGPKAKAGNQDLTRRTLLRHMGLGAGLAAMAHGIDYRDALAAEADSGDDVRALAFHKSTGVFEAYTKPWLKFTAAKIEPGNFVEHIEKMQAGMWHLREGNVRMANMSVGVPRYAQIPAVGAKLTGAVPICSTEQEVRMVLRQLDALFEAVDQHPAEMGIAHTVTEAERMNEAGKLALFLHITGAWIADDLAVLRSYRHMGVVAIHPCIAGHHAIGDAANDVPIHGGLTALGREVVKEMNRIAMVVDVAHGTDESIRDMVDLSSAPVIYSHGGCRALCDIPRNLTDELIKSIATKGGVIGIAFVSSMLSDEAIKKGRRSEPKFRDEYAKAEVELLHDAGDPYKYLEKRLDGKFTQELNKRLGWPAEGYAAAPENGATVERVVDHMAHVVKVAGIDHVGIGTDYESGSVIVGLEHAGKLPNLTGALLRRGFSEKDVRKILIDNVKRVYRKVLEQA